MVDTLLEGRTMSTYDSNAKAISYQRRRVGWQQPI